MNRPDRRGGPATAILGGVAGSDETVGLFEPDAVIRTIVGDGATVLLPAGRAILLQLAHPSVARGVAEHSDFTSRPVDRLRGSLGYIYGTVLGTRAEAEQIGRAVRALHGRINGPGYDAHDPDLQVWVAATVLDSHLDVYQRVMGPLSASQLAQAHREYAVLATMLGCPEDRWPATPAAFRAYWQEMLATLTVSDEARELAGQVLRPPQWRLRPLTGPQRLLTAGLLPPELRGQFDLPWGPRHRRAFATVLASLRWSYPRLPAPVRTYPAQLILKDLRRRMGRSPAHQ